MRLRDWLVPLVIGLGLGFWWNSRRTVELPPPAIPPAAKTLIVTDKAGTGTSASATIATARVAKNAAVTAPVGPLAVVADEKSVSPRPPPPGHVEFRVQEGLAVTQGDILLGRLAEGQTAIEKGVTRATRSRLWESAEIPYSIQAGAEKSRGVIESAIEQFHTHTNVRFVPYGGQADSLVFVPGHELCASYIGRVGGAQPIYLAPRCGVYEVMHELMHALGFVHEHSRPERERYLEVVWQNIDPSHYLQFWIIPDEWIHEYSGSAFAYDPSSMMHYESGAFAREAGLLTLRLKSGEELRPERQGFSAIDRERLFYLYGR